MYRSHTAGELRLSDAGKKVTLAGWVQRTRKMGALTFVDLRDRYGITQLVFNEETNAELCAEANKLGREYVIQVIGEVAERYSKNQNIPTGEIEINVNELVVLNKSVTPPFTIEDERTLSFVTSSASQYATTSLTSDSLRLRLLCSSVLHQKVHATSSYLHA